MLSNFSYYGNYRTKAFSDIYPEVNEFITDYNTLFNGTMKEEDLTTLYYLICGRYMNSHIANTDENQFKFKLASIIYSSGPSWAKKVEIQKILRDMPESDLIIGSKAVHNHSFNPSTAPSESTLEELLTIDDQNTTTYKKSRLEAYTILWNMIDSDVTSEFLSKFKILFIQVTQPDTPLWYVSNDDEEEGV